MELREIPNGCAIDLLLLYSSPRRNDQMPVLDARTVECKRREPYFSNGLRRRRSCWSVRMKSSCRLRGGQTGDDPLRKRGGEWTNFIESFPRPVTWYENRCVCVQDAIENRLNFIEISAGRIELESIRFVGINDRRVRVEYI